MSAGRRTAVAMAVALLAPAPASDADAASRIIDRTMVCTMVGVGYPDSVRFLTVSASPFQPQRGSPSAGLGNSAGYTHPAAGAGMRTGPAGPGSDTTTGELSMTRTTGTRCVRSRLRVPLSSRGLKEVPAGQFDVPTQRCDVPARVLIRVRAVFTRPTVLSVSPRSRDTFVARGTITTGYVAAATLRGRKPIALTSVNDASGKARIFVARSACSLHLPS